MTAASLIRFKLIVIVVALFFPWNASGEEKTQPLSPQSQAHALTTLREDCANCHGLYRAGGLGPALTPQSLQHFNVAALAAVIQEGRPSRFMPPWKHVLSPEEIRFLANYLLTEEPEAPPFKVVASP